MGAFPRNDFLRLGSVWAVLLLWAAPEKFFPWLHRDAVERPPAAHTKPPSESGDSRHADLRFQIPELALPRSDRPVPGPRAEQGVATQAAEAGAPAGGGDGSRDSAARTTVPWVVCYSRRPLDDSVPSPPQRDSRVAQPVLTSLTELGPPRA